MKYKREGYHLMTEDGHYMIKKDHVVGLYWIYDLMEHKPIYGMNFGGLLQFGRQRDAKKYIEIELYNRMEG